MACIHNQKAINDIITQINSKQEELTGLNENITKCEDIIVKHLSFKTELNCVISNLEGNHIKAGEEYDNGKIQECYDMASKTIDEASKLIVDSKNQVVLLENEIKILEQRMAALDGNCDLCVDTEKSS